MKYEHVGSNKPQREDLVVAEILVLMALVHHQVASQKLSGNSQPAASREIPPAGGQKFVTGRLSCRLEETRPSPGWGCNTKPSSERR